MEHSSFASVVLVGGSEMDGQEYISVYYLLISILVIAVFMLVFSMWQMRKNCWRDKDKK
ncbi:hypothetical protein [Pseudochrobactrum sp. XF203]|uniref:hypothetical protein n=1 Tax=Pseudochrobactrum sp. XF203 TaxID=2879116 RepID=UPI001CE24846|nr:hypothetical protein [Pseudochrobactrum sp. XF203]UCA47577.1 hypothetical protein LDL70_16105 [Pseudochrobactrum sp. XF203]